MTQGLTFLLCTLLESVVAALLGVRLRKNFSMTRLEAGTRLGTAAVIATGATYPVVWLEFSRLVDWTGTWWGATALSEAGMVLVESLFYAAALRGRWQWSFALSALVNLIAFGASFPLTSWLPRPS